MASRAPGPTTTRMDGDQNGGRPEPTMTRTEDERDGRPGWMATRTDDDENRRRRLKTEDRRRRGEEAVNRTVDPAEEAVDTGGRSAEEWGTPAINGPSRYYCPSSDVGGPKRTVDKDGRLSEDGEADG
ncbi:hypothetical protein TYRP_010468 [Tyrophagus putrescentiae]|nr:hypothetical protein TYRP_010468 [Tyrophagus putrescentiae]